MPDETKYDAYFFINLFESIPEDRWTTGLFERDGKRCVLGHMHNNFSIREACTKPVMESFHALMNRRPVAINDGNDKRYQQGTPRARVLARLRDARAEQDNKIEEGK